MSRNPEDTKYGRCEATAKSTGERCGRAATGSHGKCDIHGGDSLAGEDHPSFKHGLFSDYLAEEDRDAIGTLAEYDDAEKLDELINWRLARLRRYLREMSDEDRESFWDAFNRVVGEARVNGDPGLSASQIRELAGMLDNNNRAVQSEIDLVRKLIKDRNKIAEGEDHNVGLRDLFGGES